MGVGFNDNIVDEIKSRCNIVDVIGRHVVLKKAGNNYKGLCPFHNEKTPSFVVSDAKQIFTCFGCNATGDVLEFVQKYNHLDFQGAVETLASEYGIEVKSESFEKEEKRAALYELNREAATFFYKSFTEKSNPAYIYMKKRGLEDATLRKFGIGYADKEWDSLYKYFTNKGVEPEVLLNLGLISYSKGKYYDKYRDRVIFPIINTRGKVIGFGGRALGDGTPKYLNSPETPVFSKKNNLYGLNLTRQEINKENCAILVEGYMDAISLYQHGIRNVSASLGTALTESQAAMLKRYSENVVLSYDADEAGQAAALRGMDILHKAGCKVKVLNISDGKDPDDFVKQHGKADFLKLTQKAMAFAEYKIHLLKKKVDINTTEGSITFLQEAARILKDLSPVEADVYVKQIAKETNISEGAIRLEIYGNNNTENSRKPMPVPVQGHINTGSRPVKAQEINIILEKSLIKLMLLNSSFVMKVKPYSYVFTNPQIYRIYELILMEYKEDEEIDIKKIKDSLDSQENEILEDIIENIQLSGKEEQVFQDCIGKIEESKNVKREQEIITILSILDDKEDEDRIESLTIELMELQKAKNKDKR